MPNSLYLLSSVITELNEVKLVFVNEEGQLEQRTNREYKPYFYIAYPVSDKDNDTISRFSGEAEAVEKTELFTGRRGLFCRLSWPNAIIAMKASKQFDKCWEAEISHAKSYVYDNDLRFGTDTSTTGLKSSSTEFGPYSDSLDQTRSSDPLKYELMMNWLTLLNQPIPKARFEQLGMEAVNDDDYLRAWLLSRIANVPVIEAVGSHQVSDWIKAILHTHMRRNNVLIPTSNELRKGSLLQQVPGALTLTPKPGIYFNTAVCDFESLYASCIDRFNLSYETVDCEHSECKSNRIPDAEHHVCLKRRGIYSLLFGALKDLRIKVFKLAAKDESISSEKRRTAAIATKLLKLILVSSYGVSVRIHGLGCPPLAETITGYGRYILRESSNIAEQNGLKPLYGDTDSLFLDNASNVQIAWLINNVKNKFKLDLVLDKRYSICVLPEAKKAYFGILSDGELDIKGVTAAKSNSPNFINNVFRKCMTELIQVHNAAEYEVAKQKIVQDVNEAAMMLREGKIEPQDLIYSVKLLLDPVEKIKNAKTLSQPYQCAQQLIQSGRKLKRGDFVRFVKVRPFSYDHRVFSVKPIEALRDVSEINIQDYIRNLSTALGQVFEPMGIKLRKETESALSKWLS